MQKPLSRPRQAGELETEDSLEFLWAVSYSDMLLVLMSFFVLYFSVNDNVKNEVLDQITLAMKDNIQAHDIVSKDLKNAVISGKVGAGNNIMSGGTVASQVAAIEEAKKTFNIMIGEINDENFKVSSNSSIERGITIELPDQMFGKAKYKVNKKHRQMLTKFYNLIEKHKDKIIITVIGHTDSSKLVTLDPEVAASNMGLSTLRAVSSANYLNQLGLSNDSVEVKGVGDSIRNTRSISFHIQMKGSP